MKKKIAGIIIVALLISGFGLHRILRGKHATTIDNDSVSVSKGTITEKVVAVGNILPEQSVDVKSRIAGTVEKLYHDAGDFVKKDESLVEVKPVPTPDEYASAKQQVATDSVVETSALANYKRYQFLLKEKAISPGDQDFANAKENYHKSRLATELDKEKLALLEEGKAVIGGRAIANIIRSPITGYILQRDVDLGAPVNAQSSAQPGNTLFMIADMNHLSFQGQVSEIDASKIHKGMVANIKIAALPKLNIKGDLTLISLQSVQANSANSNSNSSGDSSSGGSSSSPFNVGFSVKVTNLKIPDGTKLLAGYSATAEITVKTAKNVLIIPERVLQFEKNKVFVWIPGDGKKSIKKYIKVGLSDGMNVEIISGLKLGDTLLISGPPSDAKDQG